MFDTYQCYCSLHTLLLGDKQARREVYTMVYGIPSHLVCLLATKVVLCYTVALVAC